MVFFLSFVSWLVLLQSGTLLFLRVCQLSRNWMPSVRSQKHTHELGVRVWEIAESQRQNGNHALLIKCPLTSQTPRFPFIPPQCTRSFWTTRVNIAPKSPVSKHSIIYKRGPTQLTQVLAWPLQQLWVMMNISPPASPQKAGPVATARKSIRLFRTKHQALLSRRHPEKPKPLVKK